MFYLSAARLVHFITGSVQWRYLIVKDLEKGSLSVSDSITQAMVRYPSCGNWFQLQFNSGSSFFPHSKHIMPQKTWKYHWCHHFRIPFSSWGPSSEPLGFDLCLWNLMDKFIRDPISNIWSRHDRVFPPSF